MPFEVFNYKWLVGRHFCHDE